MTTDYYAEHIETLEAALSAVATRGYWSPYPEHPRAYGEEAAAAGEAAFRARLGAPFPSEQPGEHIAVAERSPYGIDLGITYRRTPVDALLGAASAAMPEWAAATPETRAGVLLELLDRLLAGSFEMAHAVMATTGQSFLMAFQAGGPNALDRGLEAVAYAYAEMTRVPPSTRWEKPQGSRDPLVVDKTWRLRPRGVAVTLGVSTFPTWNGYPGIFASLATGNPVVVKPHPETILPFALFVETARATVSDAGFSPDLVTLAVDTPDDPVAKRLATDPRVAIVDYTGGSSFGRWLEDNARRALVYTEKSGVNSVIIDSADDLDGVVRNLSVSTTMYSGQMCTTPQNVYVPRAGIRVGGETMTFDEVAGRVAGAVEGLLGDDRRAADILGSIKSEATLDRIERAAAAGRVLSASRPVDHPSFPDAVVRTPVIVAVDAGDDDVYMQEMFGPVVFVVATESTGESLDLARRSALERGALTWVVYTTDEEVMRAAEDAAVAAGVSVAFNLTGGLFVNQSAAFSDFHATGANPAGNASLTDAAFVANRFRVVGVRTQA